MNIDKIPSGRTLWGEIIDTVSRCPPTFNDQIVTPRCKKERLEMVIMNPIEEITTREVVTLDDPLVSQTIEVMNQTEMLQTLVDTYSTKSGFNNYLINSCQVIPQVHFPPENTADLINHKRFLKPIWYIPPDHTNFTKGAYRKYPLLNRKVCQEVLKKAICGIARVVGYNDISVPALKLLSECVEEFFSNLFETMHDVNYNDEEDMNYHLDIMTLEKGYFAMTQHSILTMHNYLKNDIISRNRCEINEFNTIYQEYDQMMKESQNIKIGEEDFMNFLDFTETETVENTEAVPYASAVSQEQQQAENEVINLTLMNLLKCDNMDNDANFQDIFEADLIEAHLIAHQECITTPVMGPPASSLENWSLKNL